MTETTEKNEKFLGAYFDRDSVLRLSRGADSLSWVTLAFYGITWLFQVMLFMSQYVNGMMGDKGMSFLMGFNMFSPYLTQLLPGVFYFFALQAISKGLLIMLDMEDNTRRSARN
jgi:hypothetical protein